MFGVPVHHESGAGAAARRVKTADRTSLAGDLAKNQVPVFEPGSIPSMAAAAGGGSPKALSCLASPYSGPVSGGDRHALCR
jgi:hypothetical protein